MAAFTNLPVDLVIVRHGQSEANMMIEMTKRGDLSANQAMTAAKKHDSAMRLTDKGREQARQVGQWLRENAPPFQAFYCSQYVRTKETAAEMGLPNATWRAELMIRERDQGVQDGGGDVKMGLDAEEQFRMEKSPMYWQPIAGESMADVVLRVRTFLETLSTTAAGMSAVVVCHYRTIHAFRILLEEIPQEEYSDLLKESMPNGCVWWYSRRDLEGKSVHWQVPAGCLHCKLAGWHASTPSALHASTPSAFFCIACWQRLLHCMSSRCRVRRVALGARAAGERSAHRRASDCFWLLPNRFRLLPIASGRRWRASGASPCSPTARRTLWRSPCSGASSRTRRCSSRWPPWPKSSTTARTAMAPSWAPPARGVATRRRRPRRRLLTVRRAAARVPSPPSIASRARARCSSLARRPTSRRMRSSRAVTYRDGSNLRRSNLGRPKRLGRGQAVWPRGALRTCALSLSVEQAP